MSDSVEERLAMIEDGLAEVRDEFVYSGSAFREDTAWLCSQLREARKDTAALREVAATFTTEDESVPKTLYIGFAAFVNEDDIGAKTLKRFAFGLSAKIERLRALVTP